MRRLKSYALAVSALLASVFLPALAVPSWAEPPLKKQTELGLYVTAREAARMLQDPQVVFIDVRTRAEAMFVGMPQRVDVHIPLMELPAFAQFDPQKGGYGLQPNPDFEEAFLAYAKARGIGPDTPVIVMCRSGSRSAKAANLLYDLGYENVLTMIDGFEGDKAREGPMKGLRVVNGWKNSGLPWGYGIAPEQAYPEDLDG